jgi:hypothetical protein
MAISFVNLTTAVQNTNSTTITINVPSSVVDGDVMIMQVLGVNPGTYTTPTGWTLWFGTTNNRAIFYRYASSEPASYTVTSSSSTTHNAYIIAYRNAVIDVIGTISPVDDPIDAPSITTTANNAYVFASYGLAGSGGTTFSTPTGFTALASDSDGTPPSFGLFYKEQATAGATGTATSDISSGTGRGIQFSIIPTAIVVNSNFFFMMGA